MRQLHGLESQPLKLEHDPRVTPVGKWLRKLSIDKAASTPERAARRDEHRWPPAPIPEEVAGYEPHQFGRLAVKPGLTCIWQVSGRSRIGFERWVELDLEYIGRRSFWFDCWLVLRTIPAVIAGRGAY